MTKTHHGIRSGCPIANAWFRVIICAFFVFHLADVVRAKGAELQDLAPTWLTRKDARVYSLSVPAPRGQIVDRNGQPLAQSQAIPGIYLKLPPQSGLSEESLRGWLQKIADSGDNLIGLDQLDLGKLSLHQKNRPSVPFLLTEGVDGQFASSQGVQDNKEIDILYRYGRFYPKNSTAAHVIGYTGKRAPSSTSPLEDNDLLFPEDEGRDGIELVFNEFLKGEAGEIVISTDEEGVVVGEKLKKNPRPGSTIVTSLDIDTQELCERILKTGGRSGAVVILDIASGEILSLASYPAFNPNLFVPSISQKSYEQLASDKQGPLFARAFQASYPPGSTFKTFVALAALESGLINGESTINCPSGLKIGNIFFRNHGGDMGELDIRKAMAKSCNTWFYQLGLRLGGSSILDWAEAVGFGRKTGLLLPGEAEGLIPRDDYMLKVHGRRASRGDFVNMSIGQGDLLVSPLQMAQAMSIIANDGLVVQPRVILQIQDIDNTVTSAYPRRVLGKINIARDNLDVLVDSLVSVTTHGTGVAARSGGDFKVAGKTGTSQWGPSSQRKNIAWFAGFAPADNPLYAFAVAVEGGVKEKVSGGQTAAPMAGKILKELLKNYTEPQEERSKASVKTGEDEADEKNDKEEEVSVRSDGGGGLEEVIDYSDLLERFVGEVGGEERPAGGPSAEPNPLETESHNGEGRNEILYFSDKQNNIPDAGTSDRTYDYVPEDIGRVLE